MITVERINGYIRQLREMINQAQDLVNDPDGYGLTPEELKEERRWLARWKHDLQRMYDRRDEAAGERLVDGTVDGFSEDEEWILFSGGLKTNMETEYWMMDPEPSAEDQELAPGDTITVPASELQTNLEIPEDVSADWVAEHIDEYGGIALFDELEEKIGSVRVGPMWEDACNIYDRQRQEEDA